MKYEYSNDGKLWHPISKRDALKRISKGSVSIYPEKILTDLDSGKRQYINLGGYGIVRHKPRKFINGYKDLITSSLKNLVRGIIGEQQLIIEDSKEKGFSLDVDTRRELINILEKYIK